MTDIIRYLSYQNVKDFKTIRVVINGVTYANREQILKKKFVATFQNCVIFQGLHHKIKTQKIFIPQSSLRQAVFIFISQNNYLYTQLTFVFHSLEIFYIAHEHISVFYLFLLQNDLGTSDILLKFLCIEKKYIKIFYRVFLYALKINFITF